jgi:predicted metal-dependent hydrolase
MPDQAYTVRRSDRARRPRLTISDAGDVTVVLPRRASAAEADRLVVHHAAWIDRHVGRLRAERARLDRRPRLGEGRFLEVDGVPMRVRAIDGTRASHGRVDASGDQLLVRLGRDGRDATAVLEPWLRARARTRLAERVAAHAGVLSVQPGTITIRDQSSRWASASRSGALSFSWRLILAPPFVLDAVVTHELAHLRIRGHSRAFGRS